MKNLQGAITLIEEMYSGALDAMKNGNAVDMKSIMKKREGVLDLDIDMRKGHMKRVAKGKCDANLTASFNSNEKGKQHRRIHHSDRHGKLQRKNLKAVYRLFAYDCVSGHRHGGCKRLK